MLFLPYTQDCLDNKIDWLLVYLEKQLFAASILYETCDCFITDLRIAMAIGLFPSDTFPILIDSVIGLGMNFESSLWTESQVWDKCRNGTARTLVIHGA